MSLTPANRSVTASKGSFSVAAYAGDFKTLLAFNLDKAGAKGLAGFTIQCKPGTQSAYYLFNQLQYETPGDHAQDATEPPNSSINAPIYKFRWLHVPGSAHQGTSPYAGPYTYTVTPRYFDSKTSLTAIDPTLSASVTIRVAPFEKQGIELGFTRGYTQSQAFVNHFTRTALLRPAGKALQYDTTQESGTNAAGQSYTYLDEYTWLGFTAREKIFAVLNEVLADKTLHVDVCAYDLNEPDVVAILLQLAAQGRIRIILDNASLHHNAAMTTPEDQFQKLFQKVAKTAILRGKFGSFAHDKVFIVSQSGTPTKVLTGSTNFSWTGMYVNANHVVIFHDPKIAAQYQAMFDEAWKDEAKKAAFAASKLAAGPFSFPANGSPQIEVSFAPHPPAVATSILGNIAKRINQEGTKAKKTGSVLFAVMQMTGAPSPVYTALAALHKNENIFSYGISDSPSGIYLFAPDKKTGVLVTGKPSQLLLPAPFNQVPSVAGHEIHHKFVVCGFNGDDPVVYCGSSNLFTNPEEKNGDNLIAIHDGDVATAFALEALALVDHYNFLDKYARASKGKKAAANTKQAALDAHWYLPTDDTWTTSYFDPKSLHYVERNLFAGS